jgi:hypothetical protein
MEGLDRRDGFAGMDAKALSAMRVTWSSKDTTTFRKRVKQIEQAHRPAPAAAARPPDNGFRLA